MYCVIPLLELPGWKNQLSFSFWQAREKNRIALNCCFLGYDVYLEQDQNVELLNQQAFAWRFYQTQPKEIFLLELPKPRSSSVCRPSAVVLKVHEKRNGLAYVAVRCSVSWKRLGQRDDVIWGRCKKGAKTSAQSGVRLQSMYPCARRS